MDVVHTGTEYHLHCSKRWWVLQWW